MTIDEVVSELDAVLSRKYRIDTYRARVGVFGNVNFYSFFSQTVTRQPYVFADVDEDDVKAAVDPITSLMSVIEVRYSVRWIFVFSTSPHTGKIARTAFGLSWQHIFTCV